jgi:16S rRNA (adenine1518-N6/adenine1519-N6)-dimethyltransferase
MEHPKHILSRNGISPKRSLGQNFISDEQILARIVEAADLQSEDSVLEIGPGLGSLTRLLAGQSKRVVVVEIDDRLIPLLSREVVAQEHVEIVHADILETDPVRYFPGPYKAVGNVPYYITGAILRHLLSAARRPDITVLTVQREVADRIVAQPNGMSLLSVMVQFYAEAEKLFVIKAGSFWPKPDVDSAVVRLRCHPTTLVPDHEFSAFFKLVKIGFSQKRKQLQKNLRALGLPRSRLKEAFEQSGIEGRRRAQSLTVEEWFSLYQALL